MDWNVFWGLWIIFGVFYVLPTIISKEYTKGLQANYEKSKLPPLWKLSTYGLMLVVIVLLWPLIIIRRYRKSIMRTR